jgi:hypothetical protein
MKLNWYSLINALFLSSFAMVELFWGKEFTLGHTSNFVFSEATLEGVDIGSRVSFFYKSLFLGMTFTGIVYFLSELVFKASFSEGQQKLTAIIGLTGLFTVTASIFGLASGTFSAMLVAAVVVLHVLYSLYNIYPALGLPGKPLEVGYLFAGALLLFLGLGFLFNTNQFFENFALAIFIAILLLMAGGFHMLSQRLRLGDKNTLLLFLTLAFLPVISFISVETLMFFKLNYGFFIRYKILFLILYSIIVLLAVLSVAGKLPRPDPKKLFPVLMLPAVILAVVLGSYYRVIIPQPLEMFELGNPANGMMRIFSHGQIPFIDFMGSHMFSEQWYGLLYFSIFGFNGGLDFQVWQFFNMLLALMVFYVFLWKIIGNPAVAALFTISFPFIISFVFPHIFLAVFVLFAIKRVAGSQTVKNYFLWFAAVILLVVWKLDTGSAAVFSSIAFFPLVFAGRRLRVIFPVLLKALGLITGIIALLLLLAFIIRSPGQIIENLMSAIHYVKANQAHGYSSLAHSHPHQFYILHFVLPALSIVAIIYIFFRLKEHEENQRRDNVLLASMFYFITYLANFQRGLVRHSFYEFSDGFLTSVFYLAAALLMLYFFWNSCSFRRYAAFYSSAFFLFIFIKYFPVSTLPSLAAQAVENPAYKRIDLQFNEKSFQGRVIPNHDFALEQYEEFRQFLDDNLKKDQTFLDFSNTPILYFYTARPVPGYFNQNLQNTVDDFLQLQLLKRLDPRKVPVVVFSNYPPNWHDNTDGVPNVMRYYLVAEYIFQNYEPFGIISNRSIWIAKNLHLENAALEHDSLIKQVKIFDYKNAAYFAGLNAKNLKKGHQVIDLNIQNQSQINCQIYLPAEARDIAGCYLHLTIESETSGVVYVHLLYKYEYQGHFIFNARAGVNSYLIRLSNNYFWHLHGTDQVVIDKVPGSRVNAASLLNDKRL